MLQPDQMVGPYRIVGQVGQGGIATVYKAWHERLDRHVAIKVMHQAFLQDPTFLTRFEREAKIIARLDHPHIVPVYDYADVDGQPYLVMKFIAGRTLKQALLKRPLTLDEILRVMTPLADALDYAHRMGVLHRDIKPSNIILDANDIPYLTDFGMARMAQAGESTISADMMLGTPQYISPEQALGKTDLDARTDLYSLGVVLYELIVGQVPFSGDTPYSIVHDHIYRELPRPSAVNPEVPPAVEAVLMKALAKEPAQRYESAAELIEALREAVQSSGLRALAPDRQTRALDAMAKLRGAAQPDGDRAPVIPAPISHNESSSDRKGSVEFSLDLGSEELRSQLREVGQEVRGAFQEVGEQLREAFGSESWRETWAEWTSDSESQGRTAVPSDEEDAIRQRVEKSIRARNEFLGHLAAYLGVNIVLWAIYLASSGLDLAKLAGLEQLDFGFPWPLMVSAFWGAGLLADLAETYFNTGERLRRRERAVSDELIRLHGSSWHRTVREKEYKAIRTRVDKPWSDRQDFFEHLSVYIGVNAGLWSIFAFSGGGFPWPVFVSLFWGIGLFADMVEKLRGGANQRAVERAIERERELEMGEKLKRKRDSIRLTEDGELTDSMVEALEEEDKPKRRAR